MFLSFIHVCNKCYSHAKAEHPEKGKKAQETRRRRITPFSQHLHIKNIFLCCAAFFRGMRFLWHFLLFHPLHCFLYHFISAVLTFKRGNSYGWLHHNQILHPVYTKKCETSNSSVHTHLGWGEKI